MPEIEFDRNYAPARKDLLHYVAEEGNSNVYTDLPKDFEIWKEELSFINHLFEGMGLCAGIGLFDCPVDDPKCEKLGEDMYLVRGMMPTNLNGLWTYNQIDMPAMRDEPAGKRDQWTHYSVGGTAHIHRNLKYNDIPIETFLPDNFEKVGESVKEGKRSIIKFDIERGSGSITVYAKGSPFGVQKLYQPPSYRKTSISGINKLGAEQELTHSVTLHNAGINVPPVVGYYKSTIEDFIFIEEVKGKDPMDCVGEHREEIIKQDAEMLANLLKVGYRKQGFPDFDDKIFDGEKLWLIDVDELVDVHAYNNIDFRKILLDPTDKKSLKAYRNYQKGFFKTLLKDAIFRYKDSLAPELKDQKLYISEFNRAMGWKLPKDSEVKKLTTFKEMYHTYDSGIAMMHDCD